MYLANGALSVNNPGPVGSQLGQWTPEKGRIKNSVSLGIQRKVLEIYLKNIMWGYPLYFREGMRIDFLGPKVWLIADTQWLTQVPHPG